MNTSMNRTTLKDAAKEIALELERTMMQLLQTCCNCDNFDEENEICKIYNQRPPARIIVKGCDKWSELIPF